MISLYPSRLGRCRPALATAVGVVALVSVGAAFAFVGGGRESASQPRPSDFSADAVVGEPDDRETTGVVTKTADPETFAIAVAQVLFTWDTTRSTPLNEYAGRLLAVADPSGEESAGLATDLTTYLPSAESWEDLKTYETRQWIDISSYAVPDGWVRAQDSGKELDVAAGTTAYTITGLRRRSGIWQGETAKTVDEVAFTIFMTCRPTYETCHLLRLSQLNNPLR